MADLLLSVAVLVVVALLTVGLVVAFVLRRSVLSRGVGSFDCSLRREHHPGAWAPGVARYEQDRLDWFRLFAVSLRPTRSLTRDRLVILERLVSDGVASTVLPGWVVVRCAYGASTLEFAMSDMAYNGLATWLESAPPGQHVNVA